MGLFGFLPFTGCLYWLLINLHLAWRSFLMCGVSLKWFTQARRQN